VVYRRWRDELGQAVPSRAAGAGDKECVSHGVEIARLKRMDAMSVGFFTDGASWK